MDLYIEGDRLLISELVRVRWADCQVQAIERLRDPAQLPATLENLPRDLNETYIRIFEAIPETDRQSVRQVLVWVIGDSRAPWMVTAGINAKLLVEAVTFDLYGPGKSPFDIDYLKELCGCLLSVERYVEDDDDEQAEFGHDTTDADLFVSLAHYTVLEFLTSPHTPNTSVSYFAMSELAVDHEFAMGVLRQALAVDPEGTGTDWARDREAYCLTLGCALNIHTCLAKAEAKDLFVQYIDPSKPHYRRFRGIQQRATCRNRDGSFSFWLRRLPAEFIGTPEDGEAEHAARILFNLFMLKYLPGREMEDFIPFICWGGPVTIRIQDVLGTTASGIFLTTDTQLAGGSMVERHFHGEVRDWDEDSDVSVGPSPTTITN